MSADLALTLVVVLIPYALGWFILLLKPRWTFLFAYAAAMVALGLPNFFADTDPFRGAVGLLIRAAIFVAPGGPIVALRLWIKSLGERAGTEAVDASLIARPR